MAFDVGLASQTAEEIRSIASDVITLIDTYQESIYEEIVLTAEQKQGLKAKYDAKKTELEAKIGELPG